MSLELILGMIALFGMAAIGTPIAFLLGGKRHPSLPHGDRGSGLPGDSV